MFKSTALCLTLLAAVFSVGCNTQPSHPNQLNATDGSSYNSLIAAHAALLSLRPHVANEYPQYTSQFNQAAAAYAAAFECYSTYRAASATDTALVLSLETLAVDMVAVETSLENDLQVSPANVAKVRRRAARLRAAAAPQVTVTDILIELEVAATLAQTIPASAPQAALASVLIQATAAAVAAENATSGQNIDLSTIQPVAAIQ